MRISIKKILKFSLSLVLIVAILNIPVSTKQGINYKVSSFKIPLYIKIIEYLDRDYWYKELVKDITADCVTDKDRVIAIFNWTGKNIRRIPEGFDIVDDHTLNIIIRRYGTHDQMADVFATLAVYAGFPAFSDFEIPSAAKKGSTLSYVFLDNEWEVFDVYNDEAFLENSDEAAAVRDIVSDRSFVSKAEKQLPGLRLKYELKRMLNNIVNPAKNRGRVATAH